MTGIHNQQQQVVPILDKQAGSGNADDHFGRLWVPVGQPIPNMHIAIVQRTDTRSNGLSSITTSSEDSGLDSKICRALLPCADPSPDGHDDAAAAAGGVSTALPAESAPVTTHQQPCPQLVPVGDVGQVWVSGPGLAVGYLHDEHNTQQRFKRLLLSAGEVVEHRRLSLVPVEQSQTVTASQLYFHTGDLGRLLPDGEFKQSVQTRFNVCRLEAAAKGSCVIQVQESGVTLI